jgi:hypothetical protein
MFNFPVPKCENQVTDFHDTWEERSALEGYPSAVLSTTNKSNLADILNFGLVLQMYVR